MKRSILLLLALGAGLAAQAGDPPKVTRSTRTFRLDPSTGVAYADLIVAYEDPTITVTDKKAALTTLFAAASEKLFYASHKTVQLGNVTIVPAVIAGSKNTKEDPDIMILADIKTVTGTTTTFDCPVMGRSETSSLVCGDANTGGYLGVAWWLKTVGTEWKPVFQTMVNGDEIVTDGANVRVTWNALLNGDGPSLLVHELGHYLFAMRDEYEGQYFQSKDEYEGADPVDPKSTKNGLALTKGSSDKADPWNFNGTAMGYVTGIPLGTTRIFSDSALSRTATVNPPGWAVFSDGSADDFMVTEQTATVATRNGTDPIARMGGMFSLETSIRTSIPDYKKPVNASFVAGKTSVNFYNDGQANIFVFDRSGSMWDDLTWGPNQPYTSKWDFGVDFFGRLTHSKYASYRPDAKFGFIGFDDQYVEPVEVTYPKPLSAMTSFTKDYTFNPATEQSKGLEYMASNTPVFPEPWGMTNIVQALDIAKQRLDADVDRPVQRNVILLSDGAHNVGPIDPKTGEIELPSVNLGRDGAYRIFVIALNVEPDVDSYGKIMQDLASNSVGPEGAPGRMIRVKQAYAAGELAAAVKQINDDINGYNYEAGVPTTLYRDAAATDFPITFDAGQTSGHFSMAWVGNVAPTLTLTAPPPAAQTYQEANYTGIKFTNGNHLKSFDVDLTKFAPGTWILRAKSLADNPVIVVPSIALKSSKLAVNVRASTGSIYPDGKLPISVVVKDGQAIQGLKATGSLINRLTGIVSSVDLIWNGSSYSASIFGLQPGINDLTVTVAHPGTNTVFLAQGENRVTDAQRKTYPVFSTRKVSQEIWVPSKAVRKTVGVEAWMINTAVNNAQGTTMKLYLRNNTAYSMTGLKVRYFFSVSEYPNGVPGVNKNYLPQSVVKVGTVAGRPGLGYLEFDFAGKTLLPNAVSSNGQNGGENVSAIEANWSSAARWNPSNDWSAQGLTSSWAQNAFVNIYDASGALIAGNPDLEPRTIVKNAAPLIAISSSDLLVAGTPVQFTADAVDPEGDALVYTWKVDGATVASNPGMPYLMTATLTAGAHTISGSVFDAVSQKTATSTKTVMVQSATNACTTVQNNLGAASSNTNLPLAQGVNCFVIHSGAMATEWNWTNVQFQLNSDNGVALTGVSVTPILTGVTTSLSGYSQTVSTANPGVGKPLYLKVYSPTARVVRSNWWLK